MYAYHKNETECIKEDEFVQGAPPIYNIDVNT